MQGRRDAGTQGRSDAGTQGCRDAATPRCRDAGTQRCRDTRTQGRSDAGTQGRRDAAMQGRRDAAMQGRRDAGTHGRCPQSRRPHPRAARRLLPSPPASPAAPPTPRQAKAKGQGRGAGGPAPREGAPRRGPQLEEPPRCFQPEQIFPLRHTQQLLITFRMTLESPPETTQRFTRDRLSPLLPAKYEIVIIYLS